MENVVKEDVEDESEDDNLMTGGWGLWGVGGGGVGIIRGGLGGAGRGFWGGGGVAQASSRRRLPDPQVDFVAGLPRDRPNRIPKTSTSRRVQ